MENKTHWKKLTNPNYLGAYSLMENEERTVTITKVVREIVTGEGNRKEECTIAHLVGEKPFILNKTNCKTLEKVFGTPYIEEWSGRQCVIYAAKVIAFGEETEALRVKRVTPALPELSPSNPKWQGAVKALSTGDVTIKWIKDRYTLTPEFETQLLNESQS